MATPYSDIYTLFSQQISDTSFTQISQTETEEMFEQYLINAIPEFYLCKQDLSNRDSVAKQFNIDLTDMEKKILALLMVVEWIKPKLYNASLLRQTMTTSDFKIYSQANHIDELIKLKGDLVNEINDKIIRYTYQDNLDGLS
jgi:hypothetical protein